MSFAHLSPIDFVHHTQTQLLVFFSTIAFFFLDLREALESLVLSFGEWCFSAAYRPLLG
jgi:hypothetical protein